MYGACFGPAVLLGLYWRKGNGAATIASFAAGLGVLLLWNRLPWGDLMHQVFPAVFLSFVVYVAVAQMGDSYDSETVDRLFDAERAGTV